MVDMKITMVYNHHNLSGFLQDDPDRKHFFAIYPEAVEASKFVLEQLKHANRIAHQVMQMTPEQPKRGYYEFKYLDFDDVSFHLVEDYFASTI